MSDDLGDSALHQRRRGWITWTARLTAALALLAGVFYLVPIREVITELRSASPGWLIVTFLCALGTQYVVSVRLKILANVHGLVLSVTDVLVINLAVRFYGLVIPGGTLIMTVIRSLRLGQVDRKGYSGAVSAVVLDRTLATLTLAAVGITFWLLERPQHARVWFAVMVVTFLALAVPLWALSRSMRASRFPTFRLPTRFGDFFVEKMRDAVTQARRMSRQDLVRAVALSCLAHLFGVAGYACVAAALDLNLGLLTLGWIRTVLILASMIPISLSGLGLREGASLLTLTVCGVSSDASIAFSLLTAAVMVFGIGLLGGLLEGVRIVLGIQRSLPRSR